MKKSNNLNYKLICTSNNSMALINLCSLNGLLLNNVIKNDDGIEFELNHQNYLKFRKLNTSSFDIKVVRLGGFKIILDGLLYRIGLVVGMMLCLIGMYFLNNRLLQVHVYGLTTIEEEIVKQELKSMGIRKMSYMNFDTEKLESELTKKFNFSLVSIITKGNSLIISVKESLPSLENTYIPIVANYNMVISSIKVYSGTCVVKNGAIVYKGDTLVEPYIKSGESIVYVTPCADLLATAYFSSSYNFINHEEVLQRSGKKEIIDVSVKLGNWTIKKHSKQTKYQEYELEEVKSFVTQNFLPIEITKKYAYEMVKVSIERNFEEVKDKIISDTKNIAYSQVPKELSVEDENIVITPTSNGYLVNVYLSSKVQEKYVYYE